MGRFGMPNVVQKPTSHIPKKYLQIYFFPFHHSVCPYFIIMYAMLLSICLKWSIVLTYQLLGNGGHDGPAVTTDLTVMVVVELDGSVMKLGCENG
ncbi:hypothetical protein CsSME_00001585 [Camellia sinensis var. sinensis]